MSGRSAAEVRAVFGRNLTILAAKERSIAELARKLGMNRTQLHRFMEGSAFPRPDMLAVICDFFKVDARILTTSLKELAITSETPLKALGSPFGDFCEPVPHQVLPDGFYNEWKYSLVRPGKISQYLCLVYSEQGRRFIKVKVVVPAKVATARSRFALPLNVYSGEIIAQRDGFAVLDKTASQGVVAFTAYRAGYLSYDEIYPGYKLAGASYSRRLMHAHSPCLMQRLPRRVGDALAAARLPNYRDISETPDLIRQVLQELKDEFSAIQGQPRA